MELLQIENNTDNILKFLGSYSDTQQGVNDLFLFAAAMFQEQMNNGINNIVALFKLKKNLQATFFEFQNKYFMELIQTYIKEHQDYDLFPTQKSEKCLDTLGIKLEQLIPYLKISMHFSSTSNFKQLLQGSLNLPFYKPISSIFNYILQIATVIMKSSKVALKLLQTASLLPNSGKKSIQIKYIYKSSHLNDSFLEKQIIESLIISLQANVPISVVALCGFQCNLSEQIMKTFELNDQTQIKNELKKFIQ